MTRRSKRSYGGMPKRREPSQPATGHTFLIIVEGKATEPTYLCEVRSRLKRKGAAVVVRHGDHTDPAGIVREAVKLRDQQAARSQKLTSVPFDQVWVVFDSENQNHPRREQLPGALKLAAAHEIRVALSVPAFEYWLLLHYHYTTSPFDGCGAVKKTLKKFIKDYEKADLPLDDLLRRITTAVKHAAQCRSHWKLAGGDRNPSTDVDQLLHELNASARSDLRLF